RLEAAVAASDGGCLVAGDAGSLVEDRPDAFVDLLRLLEMDLAVLEERELVGGQARKRISEVRPRGNGRDAAPVGAACGGPIVSAGRRFGWRRGRSPLCFSLRLVSAAADEEHCEGHRDRCWMLDYSVHAHT